MRLFVVIVGLTCSSRFLRLFVANDMYRAYPLNAAALAELQKRIVQQLPLTRVGQLAIVSHSAHIYSDCWKSCDAIVRRDRGSDLFVTDPRGSFVFYLEDNMFVADHYSVSGDLLQTFSAASAKSLGRQLVPFIGRIDHAMYVGRELERLERSRNEGKTYSQGKV
jgi:thymidylate synthase